MMAGLEGYKRSFTNDISAKLSHRQPHRRSAQAELSKCRANRNPNDASAGVNGYQNT